jgi:capsule polysaccharide export protein KpsE/RkpR
MSKINEQANDATVEPKSEGMDANAETLNNFQDKDIEVVKKLQAEYAITTAQIGQIEIELHLLNKRLEQVRDIREKLFEKYSSLQTEETELVKSLNEQYGDGVLDLDSGKFIPTE